MFTEHPSTLHFWSRIFLPEFDLAQGLGGGGGRGSKLAVWFWGSGGSLPIAV